MATQIPEFNEDLNVISKLGDNPNTDDGLSAADLKAQFDRGPNLIKKFINDYIVPAINNYVVGTGFLLLNGGTMKGNIAMSGNRISGLNDPADNQDAATKIFVEERVSSAVANSGFLAKSGGTMTGGLNMNGNTVTGLGYPANSGDAVPKFFLDNYVVPPELGGTGAQNGADGLANMLAAGRMRLSAQQIVSSLPSAAELPEGTFVLVPIQKVT